MPIATILALAEQYGPTLFGLAIKYGPTIVGLIKQYGPTLESQVGPLVAASAQAGTLEADIGTIVARRQALAPLLGASSSLADIADALSSVGSAAVEDPAMERAEGGRAR